MANDNIKVSALPNILAAADLAAGDIFPTVDISAEETKQLTAMSAALGLTKLLFFEDEGGDDAYVVSTGLSLDALFSGFAFALKVTTGNTGACTITVDSVTAKAVKVVDASGVRDPLTGEITAGMTALLSYNGTYFILLNPVDPVKRFIALLTANGTSDPTVSIVKNTLGEVPTITRNGAGDYRVTTVSTLFTSKTIIPTNNVVLSPPAADDFYLTMQKTSTTQISISTQIFSTSDPTDDALSATLIEIQVHP